MIDTPSFSTARLSAILASIQECARLKDTLRSGRTRAGRQESTAEHSWRLTLLILLCAPDLPDYDTLKLLKLAIVHDLGEALSGDVPATAQARDPGRVNRERADFRSLIAGLPHDLRDQFQKLWEDYTLGGTPEAVLVKAFDKIETMAQHLVGAQDPDFDYAFNLAYGRKWTDRNGLTRALRALVDAQTRDKAATQSSAAAGSGAESSATT